MKSKSVLFALLLLCCFPLMAQQVVGDTTDFSDGLPAYLVLDTSQANNLWQVGQPSKVQFNSAFSPTAALMTDTLNLIPPGNTSSLILQFPSGTFSTWSCISQGWMKFMHRYDFDSLKAGGTIEIRYFDPWVQEWTDWTHLYNDTFPDMKFMDGEYPVAMIQGGIPAYTGNSGGWKNAEFSWVWLMLVKGGSEAIFMSNIEMRFTALSDSSAAPSEGWMIDDFELIIMECVGSVEDLSEKEFLSRAYPNPGSGDIRIDPGSFSTEPLSAEVFSVNGLLMETRSIQPGEEVIISASTLPAGYYFYRLTTRSGKYSTGRFIKI